MTTSGVNTFSVSRDNIITDALMMVGGADPDNTPSTSRITHAARVLNMLVKNLSKYGISLWARKTGYILPVSDTNSIILGPAGGHATVSYVQTSLTASASGTSITVASATGIANGYNIGVELSDGSMHWTTVNGAPAGLTVTLTTALPSGAFSGNYVYCYQTKIQRPLRVVDSFLHNQTTNSDVSIEVVSKAKYDSLTKKDNIGSINQLTYDPQLDNGVAYIWPRFADGKSVVTIIFQRPFEDFVAGTDTPDLPQEWYDPITVLLASRLAPTYGLPVSDRQLLKQEAREAIQEVLGNEPEEGSIQITFDG